MKSADQPVIRIAELEIDPAQIDAYRAALADEIECTSRHEPQVQMLYALSIKDNPAQVRIVEVYSDLAAYEAHIRSAHFLKYKAATEGIVRSLRLVDAEIIAGFAKTRNSN